MTCKDCLHYPACTEWNEKFIALRIENGSFCKDFKNKADFVEVVRCKDCEHWGGVTFGYICRRFSGSYIRNETRENDFCSYGKRKDI